MAKNTPAFQFYPSDFLGGVMMLSDEAAGVYWKLLCSLWIQGNLLPFCYKRLAIAAQTTPDVMERIWPMIADKFVVSDSGVTHPRFSQMMELAEKRRKSGSKGGKAKAQTSSKSPSKAHSKSPSKSLANSRRTKYEERSTKKEDEVEDWVFPKGWDSPELRRALDDFEAMRRRIKKPVKSRKSTSKIFKRFDSPEHLARAAEECEANEWQGLKPDYGKESNGNRNTRGQTPGARSFAPETL